MKIRLPDVGEKSRRAEARFFRDGLMVEATDAKVAEHAVMTVIEALEALIRHLGGTLDSRYRHWMRRAVEALPDRPDALGSIHFSDVGDLDADAVGADDGLVGYGYVKPLGMGHECGGVLFDHEKHEVRKIAAQYIFLMTDDQRPQ